MAKKNSKPLGREERPEFLAMLAALPDDVEAMHARAGQLRAVYNDAIVAGDDGAREAAALEHDAIVFKLNGGTFFGCRGDATSPGKALDALHAVKPGQVPSWGQDGEFLVEVEGVRVLVKYECQGLRSAPGFDARAVDFDKPFISPTGYQGVYLTVTDHMGRTLEQAARAEISAQIAAEGLKQIATQDLQWIKSRPTWLVDVLAGVTRDGQLAMFGDQPAPKKPLSGKERQKRRRDKLRELKESEGLREVRLNAADLAYLWRVVDAGVTICPDLGALEQLETCERLARLFKGSRELSLYGLNQLGHSPDVAGELGFLKKEQTRFAEQAERRTAEALQRVQWLERENAQAVAERGEAFRAVEVLQRRLRDAGLSTDYRW